MVPASTFTTSPAALTEEPAQPTQTLTQPLVIPSTLTAVPSETQVDTPTASPTVTPSASPTVAPAEPTSTSTPKPSFNSVVGVPIIKYPNGNNLTLFWNDTSFHMLNRSRAARSLSGFTFQRLDENDLPTDTFPGYRWENRKFKYIPSKNCVSIKIYKDEDPPYLDPADCNLSYSSIIQPEREKEPGLFFWVTQEGSAQFRVLWLNEEVARCEISAGTCEIYIP
jgi:hypothetical protein